jgi:hypothetical protein
MKQGIKGPIFESLRRKYGRSGRKEKGLILNEVCAALGCHRKHAVRLLSKRSPGRIATSGKRGPKSKYNTPEFLRALHKVRRVMEFRNAEVMKGNMPEWLPFIEQHYGTLTSETRELLLRISAATMKRYFRLMREQGGQGLSTTRPGSILRTEIPIRTESFWNESVPGKMAADTVAHCGSSTEGQFAYSLDMVDPVTHWTAQRATWGKGQAGVLEQTTAIEKALPFSLIGLHVDNGSEFMNHAYIRHFTTETIRNGFSFTRSRANQKNDNCHIEQKNWSVVRRYFGYDRIDVQELVPMMNDLYANELYLYLNHFCRTFKLEQKVAIKSRYRRIYGQPLTPYERVLASPHINEDIKGSLRLTHAALDPVALKLSIERKLRIIAAELRRVHALRVAKVVA